MRDDMSLQFSGRLNSDGLHESLDARDNHSVDITFTFFCICRQASQHKMVGELMKVNSLYSSLVVEIYGILGRSKDFK